MAPSNNVVVDGSPPAYSPQGYGTIQVHHHHHHRPTVTIHSGRRRNTIAYFKAFLLTFLILFLIAMFAGLAFAAWNFYNLSQCEKNRMPWDKPCKDWLGRDAQTHMFA